MNGIKNNFYFFPNKKIVLTSEALLLEYLDEIKDFFVNTLGFYYKGRQTYKHSYIDYYSDKEDGRPIFCFYNNNSSDTSFSVRWANFFLLSPCTFNGENYMPLKGYPGIPGSGLDGCSYIGYLKESPWSICFNYQYHHTAAGYYYNEVRIYHAADIIVQDSKFDDGRRAIFFKAQKRDTGIYNVTASYAGLFYTDIIYKNQLIRDWVIMGKTFNTSYDPRFECNISNADNIETNHFEGNGYKTLVLLKNTSLESTGGLLPILNANKDYLLKQNFYIGEEAYIPDIYRYSNLLGSNNKKGLMGNIVTIKNIDYLILYNNRTEFDNYKGNYEVGSSNNIINNNPGNTTIMDTIINEALIVPINK